MNKYLPEGYLIRTEQNRQFTSGVAALKKAMENGIILEGVCRLCDREHNLHVSLGEFEGIIPRMEGAAGIESGEVRDIALISRVNKPVSFLIKGITETENGETRLLLSRREVQKKCREEYINKLRPGDVLKAKITHMESFGVFADIGCGINALLPIDSISVSRIPHPNARFVQGQEIRCIVKSIEDNRITLTHKELLGTWEENAKKFTPGETVPGVVRSVEKYGIFVELAPNLAGLAEYVSGINAGQHASVYIKSMNPEKMKIKLIIIDNFDDDTPPAAPEYFMTDASHIDYFRYSPMESEKLIETKFC